MHYIIGYTFLFKDSKRVTKFESQGFEVGRKYQIYYIKPEKEKVVYTFRSGRGVFSRDFPSIHDAEEVISKLANDVVPDYSSYYKNRKN